VNSQRRGPERERGRVSTAWRKISGREDLERAIDQRYEPYEYESNANLVRWITGGMVLWILLMGALVVTDRSVASTLERYETQGFTAVPPGSPEPEELFAYSREQGLACTTPEDVTTLATDCGSVFDFRRELRDTKDRASWVVLALFSLLVVNAFVFSLFTHRASRNLLALGVEKQRFSPEWAVGCFYIPVMNVWRPFQVFAELFRGSIGGTERGPEQAANASTPPVMIVWWLTLIAGVVLNPIVFGLMLGEGTVAEARSTASTLAWVDLWLMIPAFLAILVVRALHQAQEARFRVVGPRTVTRPPPEPPF